jgi:hypothetical protein
VRRLQLSAPTQQENSRALRILEESLRLMELPGESAGRVYYFRRLKFPRLRHAESPTSYASRLEHFCRDRAGGAAHFLDPSAEAHDVVFARSPAEPWAAMLRDLVQHRALEAWFWSAAVGPAARTSRPRALPDLLVDLGKQHGPDRAVEVLVSLEPAVLDAVLQQLETRHVESGMLGGVWRAARHSSAAVVEESRTWLARVSAERRSIATEFISRWPHGDVRAVWLASLLVLGHEPARALDRRIAELATAIAVQVFEQAAQAAAVRTIRPARNSRAPAEQAIGPEPVMVEPAAAEAQAESGPLADPSRDSGVPTACAGIFFLLGELHRMGIAATLSATPDLIGGGFVQALLTRLIRTAKAGADPAGHALMAILPEDTLKRQPSPTSDRLARAWIVALRRRIWRAARMTLAEVAERRGIFFVTRTHLEVVLPQNSLDLRVRKTGLDIDPGWLPWLGRIVSFRYLCEVRDILPATARPHPGVRR